MSEQEMPAQAPEVLYDINAPQWINLSFERNGRTYPVRHRLDPLTDKVLTEYGRRRNTRFTASSKADVDEGGLDQTTDNFGANCWLWDELATEQTGYKPCENWKEKVPLGHKDTAISQGLMVCEVVPAPKASAGELFDLDATDETVTVRTRCFFDEYELTTTHVTKAPTADQVKRYKALMSRRTIVAGTRTGRQDIRVGEKTKPLAELYDEIKIRADGYVDGKVPAHHKQVVAMEVFGEDGEVSAKN